MLDPDFDPYDILANHSQAINNLIGAIKDNSHNQLKMAEANKDLNNSMIRIYTEMKSMDHRIQRLERQYNAFEQTPTNNRPER